MKTKNDYEVLCFLCISASAILGVAGLGLGALWGNTYGLLIATLLGVVVLLLGAHYNSQASKAPKRRRSE